MGSSTQLKLIAVTIAARNAEWRRCRGMEKIIGIVMRNRPRELVGETAGQDRQETRTISLDGRCCREETKAERRRTTSEQSRRRRRGKRRTKIF